MTDQIQMEVKRTTSIYTKRRNNNVYPNGCIPYLRVTYLTSRRSLSRSLSKFTDRSRVSLSRRSSGSFSLACDDKTKGGENGRTEREKERNRERTRGDATYVLDACFIISSTVEDKKAPRMFAFASHSHFTLFSRIQRQSNSTEY